MAPWHPSHHWGSLGILILRTNPWSLITCRTNPGFGRQGHTLCGDKIRCMQNNNGISQMRWSPHATRYGAWSPKIQRSAQEIPLGEVMRSPICMGPCEGTGHRMECIPFASKNQPTLDRTPDQSCFPRALEPTKTRALIGKDNVCWSLRF